MIASLGFLLAAVSIAIADDQFTEMSAFAAVEQAHWAKLSVWLTCVSLVISIAALVCLYFSLLQTRQAVTDTRTLGEAQMRAYVEAVKLEYSKDKGDIVVECQNSGQTPSLLVGVGLEAIRVHETRMYNVLVNRPETPPRKTWPAIAAGRSLFAKLTPDTGSSAVEQLINGLFSENERLLIVGTILYRDVFDIPFQSDFAFFVDPSDVRTFLRPNGKRSAFQKLTPTEFVRALGVKL